jgi:hypothetical protein
MIVELDSGRKILLGGSGPAAGLSEASVAGDVAKATAEGFKAALGSLAELVGTLQTHVGNLASRPDKVEMEFRASLSGEADLWVVSGDGEAEFRVTLTWGKD